MATRLTLARLLLLAGLTVGLLSWRESVGHIGRPDFLVPGYEPPTHAWYHVFRQASGDVSEIAVFLLTFFGPTDWRTPVTWWIGLILMMGYYAPFWVGEPFVDALAAPNRPAGIIHATMAALGLLALLVARPSFHQTAEPSR